MTKEGPMSRTAKSKPAQPNATAEIKKLVVKLLSVDPKLLRNSVLTLKRVCLPEVLRRLAKSLVDRALMEDSGPASDVVGFLGPRLIQASFRNSATATAPSTGPASRGCWDGSEPSFPRANTSSWGCTSLDSA